MMDMAGNRRKAVASGGHNLSPCNGMAKSGYGRKQEESRGFWWP